MFFNGNGVFASLLHHVCHLAFCAGAAPEVCQQGGKCKSFFLLEFFLIFILIAVGSVTVQLITQLYCGDN